jgi:hypothetical protein
MPRSWTFAAIKPYLGLALAAFLAGFASYVLVGDGSGAAAREPAVRAAATSAPVSDSWNLPKHI